jgi:integrase
MAPELAEVLLQWRRETPYPMQGDWVFASPFTQGIGPYWPESALADHIRPAAKKAGITKNIGWHTFRHSFASLMGERGEGVKTVQELLRHASSRVTQDIYQQGNAAAKRTALTHMAGMFAVPPAS